MASLLPLNVLSGQAGDAADWNWRENFVQVDENMATSSMFIAAESTLIGFGPPNATSQFDIVKVGLTPNISLSQQIPQQRLPEIGSMRVHILNGIPVGGGSMSRLVYNGPSLMRYAYGNLFDADGKPSAAYLASLMNGSNNAISNSVKTAMDKILNTDKVMRGHKDTDMWISCWDQRVIKMPFGIALYFQDTAGNAVGGCYAEGVKINSHNLSQSAGQLIMVEGISFACERIVPIKGIGRSMA